MMKKLVFVVASVAVLVATLGATAGMAKPKQQVVSLQLTALAENRLGWDIIIGNFQRVYPNIKIVATYIPVVSYFSVLPTQAQAGNLPDLFSVNGGNTTLAGVYPFGAQGHLLDLSGSPWTKRILRQSLRFVSRRGRIHAYPIHYNVTGLNYNRDTFRQMGLKVPTTFAQLLALCRTVSAAGKVPIAAGLASSNAQQLLSFDVMVNFVYNKDPDWTIHRIQRKTTFAGSPLFRNALNALSRMRDANCFQPRPEGTTLATQYQMVASGQALMTPNQLAGVNNLRLLNPQLNLGYFPIPAEAAKDTHIYATFGTNAVAASAKTQYPEEAKTFINFIARPKQSELFAKTQGTMTPTMLKTGQGLPDVMKEMLPTLKAGRIVTEIPGSWPKPSLWIPGWNSQVVGLFTGQRTVDSFLQTMDTLWDAK